MKRILIIDDSLLSRKLLTQAVKNLKAEVVAEAKDGFEGVQKFTELKPDLVLLDVTMPNKDGRETLKEILALDPSAKVVMVTAVKNEDLIQDCIRTGAKGFVQKSNAMGNSLETHLTKVFEEVFSSNKKEIA